MKLRLAIAMKRLFLLALLVPLSGCAVRKPVQAVFVRPMKEVVKGMYCDQRDAKGRCLHWAKHPYDCTHDVYGDCQK